MNPGKKKGTFGKVGSRAVGGKKGRGRKSRRRGETVGWEETQTMVFRTGKRASTNNACNKGNCSTSRLNKK